MPTPVERILEALPGHWRVVPIQGKRPNAGLNWPAKAVRTGSLRTYFPATIAQARHELAAIDSHQARRGA